MLDRETLQKVRRIRIRTRAILESGIVGSYHAVFKGRGMEFASVREYTPGDDVRSMLPSRCAILIGDAAAQAATSRAENPTVATAPADIVWRRN